jgi:glycosyltransferase involved in cell wall biosynthesis
VSENRRLLFVAPSAYPLGGVATWLDYLLPGLEEHGWEPTLGLVAGKYHDADRYLEQHPFHRVLNIQNSTGSQEGRIQALCNAILKVSPAVALSVNIPDLYMAQARLRNNRRSAAKTVMTLHGIQADLLSDIHAFRRLLDAVICTNRLTCQLVHEVAEVAKDRICYAPYGVEISATAPVRSFTTNNDRPMRIAWVGRLEQEQKRVGDLPDVLTALEARNLPFELWVVGSGSEEAKLRQRLTRWLERGQAKLLGELPRDRVCAEIYPQANCFLLTSSWETGPIVVWEAMSAGLPVVSSKYLGCGPEGSLIHEANCLMYPVGSAKCAAQKISMLWDPKLYNRLSAGGFELVRQRYSVKASIDYWDAVLQKIVNKQIVETEPLEFAIAPRGRLDRWFGVGTAESIRQVLRIKHVHTGAGGEWPHTLSQDPVGGGQAEQGNFPNLSQFQKLA